MTKLSTTGLRARLNPVLTLVMLLLFTGSAFADQFYFSRSRAISGGNPPPGAEDGATGLFLWNDATGVQSQVGGDGVYLRHLLDGPIMVDAIASNSAGVLYGFAVDDTANATFLPYPAALANVCSASIRSRLVAIDTSTAVFSYVGPWLPGRDIRGAGFDSQGRLWALDCTAGEVFEVELATGNPIGSPIATGLSANSAADIDFAANGLGIIGYSGLQFRVFNTNTGSIADVAIAAVNGTAPNAFDSGLIPPYGVSGVAFTTHLAARNGSPVADSCRLNIFEGRGLDELGHANDPFFANPVIAFREAAQYNPPSPPWNAGGGDAARVGGPALPDCFYDWGDAPASYGTLGANNGPRHLVTATSPYLGSGLPDFEVDGVPNAAANGDDGNGGDEDGVTVPLLERTVTVPIQVQVGNATAATSLQAWIDWDRDGSFAQPGDQIIVDAVPVNGPNTFNVAVPATAAFGTTYARFRIADESGLTYQGAASTGEVEDHLVTIEARPPVDYFPTCPISQAPPPTNFDIQQRWSTPDVAGQRTLAYQTPVVGDLFGTGQPVVVVAADHNFVSGGLPDRLSKDLLIVNGSTGAILSTIVTPLFNWSGHSVVALADVDGDGQGEIILKVSQHSNAPAAVRGRLIAYRNDGTQMWLSDQRYDYSTSRGGISLNVADFNGDGVPEVYAGNQIFNARTGVRLAALTSAASTGCPHRASAGVGCFFGQTVAADMDGDGLLELVAGNVVYKVNITNPNGETGNSLPIWQQATASAGVGDGYTAVADVDLDGDPDVVVVRTVDATSGGATRIFVWDGQTAAIMSMLTNVGTVGGPPLLGDIDGDGGPEIVAVTALQLRAFKYQAGTGLISKWNLSTNDGSGTTSLSMFDFNNDGSRELVYRDQDLIRIIDGSGATAANLASFACTSGTATDMPVIASLDSTREARILVTCGSAAIDSGNVRGTLRAFETASFPWAATRPVWNQQAYFVTHVDNDLSIPADQFPHWTVFSDAAQACSAGVNRPLNGFQQQVPDLDGTTGCPVSCPLAANISVDKTASADVAMPGGTVTYTVVATNTGPGAGSGSQVQDPFPAGIVSATWTCAAAGGAACPNPNSGGTVVPPFMVNETVTTLPVNGVLTYTIIATVADPMPAAITNTASVTGPVVRCLPDGTLPPCDSPPVIVERATADLAISKVSAPNPYDPGAPFFYTIIVSNLGPDDAPGAVVSDTFPSQLSAATWSCTGSGAATCSATGGPGAINDTANLPAGGSVTYTVTGIAPTGPIVTLTNTATVTPPPGIPDPVLANNTAIDVNPGGPKADLRISKASTPNPFVPGETLTYTVVVTNAGPSDAAGARVQDPLPPAFASFTWTCAAGPGAVCVTPNGTGDIDALLNLPVGATATYTSTGTVPSGYASTATNTATIAPPPEVTDPVPGNNTSTTQNPPGPMADLAITKAQTPDPYVPGGALTYTLLVENHGPSDATNARVQDVFPGELANVTWTCAPSGAGASCGTPAGSNVIDTLVTVPVGTTATFTISASVPSSLTDVLINTATVTPPLEVTDPVPGNNTSTVTSGAAPEADLSIVKTASVNPYVPGGPLSFSIVVSNAGPSDAPNSRVQDLFPAPLSGFTWTCAPSTGAATCGAASGLSVIDVLVNLPVGSAVTFTASGVVPPDTTGSLTNTATVAPPVEIRDPDLTNNLSAVTVGYGPQADLRLTKTSTPNPYVPGTPIVYTVVITNDGPSALVGGRVRDVMPAALQNITWTCSAVDASCPAPSGTGSIDALVDISVGGTVTFTITADVPAQTRGVLINTATILPPPDVVDPNPSNNSGVNSNPVIVVGGPADLQITQEFPGVAPPNGLLTFRLRSRNLGSNTALNPYMTGLIPPGTTFVSVTPSAGGTCNVPGNPPAPDPATGYPMPGAATEPLRCTWPGLMKPGESHYMEFTVRVAPGTPTGQILWSCWWTWSETDDPYHANNVVDAYLFVDDGMSPVGDLAIQAAALSEGVIATTLPTRVGTAVPMRFWVTNHGPAATRGQYALILDTASTIEVLEFKLPQGWVSPSGPASAVWDTGPVAPGQTVALDLTVRMRATTSVELFAQRIAGSPGDPNAANERATIVLDGYGPGAAGRWVAVGNVDGAGAGEIVTGAGQGETPQVRVFTGAGADTGERFFAYERPFLGGVRIASCDVDGDGIGELITAPGPGRAPSIRVLSLLGGVVTELVAFDAFEPGFLGGASIACADLDADGAAELIIGAGPGRAPEVQVYNVGLSSIVPRATFLAYEADFLGGVRVAAGAYPGRAGWLDAFAIATTPGAGRAPELRLWTETGAPVAQVVVSTATNGVLPTLGDMNGDGQLDLLLAPDDGRPELVKIFNVDTGELLGNVQGGMPSFPVGIRTAIGVLEGGPGQPEIVIGNGPGGHPRVRVIYWPPAGPVQRLEILPLEIP